MGQPAPVDPAWALDRKALTEGWPFRCDSALNFIKPELNEMRDLWCALAANERAPSRADFDARRLKPFIRNITIIERVPIDAVRWHYRVRLAGSAIAEAVGDHTGRFLEEYLPRESVPRWTATYDAAIEGGQPLRLTAEFIMLRIDHLSGEAFIAPLCDNEGKLTLVIGCIYFKPKRAPS